MRRLRFVCVAVGLLAAACGQSEPEVAATPPSTTTLSAAEAEAALELGERFVAGYNAHDANALMTLMASEASFANNFGGEVERDFWHGLLAWNAAQGSTLSDADCSVTGADGTGTLVACRHGTHDAVSQAVDGPPVPTVTTLTVTPDGIVAVFEEYSSPDFNHVLEPFRSWLATAHPDVAAAGTLDFAAWADVDEAAASGALIPGYAAEWAAYLDENGCTYLDDC